MEIVSGPKCLIKRAIKWIAPKFCGIYPTLRAPRIFLKPRFFIKYFTGPAARVCTKRYGML